MSRVVLCLCGRAPMLNGHKIVTHSVGGVRCPLSGWPVNPQGWLHGLRAGKPVSIAQHQGFHNRPAPQAPKGTP